MAIKYTSYIAKASKIYPNSDFWFENIPSGSPARRTAFNAGYDAVQAFLGSKPEGSFLKEG
jgi:hypothetical protein